MQGAFPWLLIGAAIGGAVALTGCSDTTTTPEQRAGDALIPPAALSLALQQLNLEGTACHTIDFNQFDHADVITTLPSGLGFNLTVAVTGYAGSLDVARAYDTNTVDGPDTDLEWFGPNARCPDCENQGRVLVVEDERGFDDFGDAVDGGQITFTGFAGNGTFWITEFKAIDIEDEFGETLVAYADATAVGAAAGLGDGTVETVITDATQTFETSLMFDMRASGAIDDIEICTTLVNGAEGCTPGYWRNHSIYAPGNQGDSWLGTGYHADDFLDTVFDFPAGLSEVGEESLHTALTFGGGGGLVGGARILLRAAVASLLNAAHDDVNFGMTEAEIISAVNAALAGTRANMLALAEDLDALNNAGCPIS